MKGRKETTISARLQWYAEHQWVNIILSLDRKCTTAQKLNICTFAKCKFTVIDGQVSDLGQPIVDFGMHTHSGGLLRYPLGYAYLGMEFRSSRTQLSVVVVKKEKSC